LRRIAFADFRAAVYVYVILTVLFRDPLAFPSSRYINREKWVDSNIKLLRVEFNRANMYIRDRTKAFPDSSRLR